jgi:hypothetical protein
MRKNVNVGLGVKFYPKPKPKLAILMLCYETDSQYCDSNYK